MLQTSPKQALKRYNAIEQVWEKGSEAMTESPPGNTISPEISGRLSLWRILQQTLAYYRQHGAAFTRVLLLPVAQMALASYGCVALVNGLVDYAITQQTDLVQNHLWLVLTLIGLICLMALFFVIRGGWQYVVYWASLNRNALEAIEQKPIDFKAAYQAVSQQQKRPYQLLLAIYCALPLGASLPVLLTPLLIGLFSGMSELAGPLLLLVSCLLSGLLLSIWLVAAVFMSFIFQIAGLEPLPGSPAATLLYSARLTLQRFWATLGLQVILLIVTNYLLNLPLALLLRLLHLSQPLDALNQWLIQSTLEGAHISAKTDMQAQLLSLADSHVPELAASVTDAILMLLITALLLPLGTFAFTLLYRDILAHFKTDKTAL